MHTKPWRLVPGKLYHLDRQFPLTDAKQFGISNCESQTVTRQSTVTSQLRDRLWEARFHDVSFSLALVVIECCYCIVDCVLNARNRVRGRGWINSFRMCVRAGAYFISHSIPSQCQWPNVQPNTPYTLRSGCTLSFKSSASWASFSANLQHRSLNQNLCSR